MIARKAYAPDDDEGKMIEIISRAEIASSSACSGIGWKATRAGISLRQTQI